MHYFDTLGCFRRRISKKIFKRKSPITAFLNVLTAITKVANHSPKIPHKSNHSFQSLGKNIRLIVMNNLLPQSIKMHHKFDLKGSTYKRLASRQERNKPSPTLKDLDFNEEYPNGIILDPKTYDILTDIIKRDCLVLESFKIMDYSFLIGIHNVDVETFTGNDETFGDPEEREHQHVDAEEEQRQLSARTEAWRSLQLDFNTKQRPYEYVVFFFDSFNFFPEFQRRRRASKEPQRRKTFTFPRHNRHSSKLQAIQETRAHLEEHPPRRRLHFGAQS